MRFIIVVEVFIGRKFKFKAKSALNVETCNFFMYLNLIYARTKAYFCQRRQCSQKSTRRYGYFTT